MAVFCLMIPFFGTALGAATVFLMQQQVSEAVRNLMIGFASGIMLAASVWSLLLPAIELSGSILPYTAGFMAGTLLLILPDKLIQKENRRPLPCNAKTAMMALAVTLHNVPEGMAVGVTLAAAIGNRSGVTMTAAMVLSAGIALQNIPEGAVISLPLKAEGVPKSKAFLYGALSGAVEPIAGVFTLLLSGAAAAALPCLLAFAAGAMVYVVAKELIPESHGGKYADLSQCGLTAGFVVMMLLDVCFS